MAVAATVTGVISEDAELTGVELDIAARKALAEVVGQVIIPEAARNAPGSVGSQLRMGQIRRMGVGVYAVNILAPKKYLATEHGSGVFVGAEPYTVEPRTPGGVLLTEDGAFIRWAEQIGQPAQLYIHNAIQAHLKDVADTVFQELRNGLSSRVASSPAH
jgi:hypothetical protein